MKKFLLSTLVLVLTGVALFAQVTTGVITGSVKDEKGETLIGATVKATHVPSGSTYSASTNANGQYTIPNVRVGGPFTLVISYVGFDPKTINDLYVNLGNPLRADVVLLAQSRTLSEVTVTANKNSVISSQRTGASTTIGQAELQQLPTITRNIQDFVRLTPQVTTLTNSSTGAALGISIAGMHNRYNRFSIDGANASDVFGLSSSGTNGGQTGTNPIPLDAIQEMQVVLSPYDVTLVGFAGGGINAVTKSGTNSFHGSAYTYLQNEKGVGKSVTANLKYPNFDKTIYGASLGGPIVKNKLFFFANFERSKNTAPIAFNPAEAGSGSKFDLAALKDLHDFVLNKYGFDPGSYTNVNKKTPSTTIFGRLDWNINDKNKLTLRHSYVDASDFILSRSATSLAFSNSGYTMASTTNSSVLELNSNLTNSSSNIFRVTYNRVRDKRITSMFPNISITDRLNGNLQYTIGSEFSSGKNSLDQDNFSITDNFTLYKGNHTITFGTNNDFYNTKNVFLQGFYGAYTYAASTPANVDNIATFKNNSGVPSSYTVNYSTAGGADEAPSKIHAAQFRVYAQDVMQVTDKFKMTFGTGLELPVFFNDPLTNPKFNGSALAAANNVATNKTTKTQLYVTPRIGFNWDMKGDATSQLRGGVGVFTGPSPFVWISNQYGGTGVNSVRYTTITPDLRFNYDPSDPHLGAKLGSSSAATEIDVTDRDFKFPTVFRTNVALDKALPFWGLIGTLEAIYTKTFDNLTYQNLNTAPQNGVVTIGNSTRPWYNFARRDANFTDVLEITNTNKGYTYNLTAQIQKPMTKGWTGSIAYTYGEAYSLSDGTSSTAISNWRFAYNVNGLNNLDLARSNFSPGSRVIGYVSKSFKYFNSRLGTTIGLVYSGQSGQRFSYLYSGNVNGDDPTQNSNAQGIAYIPANLTEAQFATLGSGATAVTPQVQYDNFQKFVAGNKYLREHVGKVTERNGDVMPWENHFDLKIAQDFYFVKQHKLEVSLDMFNVGNLLNKDWGRAYFMSNQSYNLFSVVSKTKTPTFTFDASKLNNVDGTLQAYSIADFTSRWRGQLSLRYQF